MPASKFDLDQAPAGDRRIRDSRGCPDILHDLDRQKLHALRRAPARQRRGRKASITQPFEDQVRVDRVTPRDLSNRNARSRRLKADRPLLLVRPEPLRPTRHASTIVSTIQSGHYRSLPEPGRAVRPDAYRSYRSGPQTGRRLRATRAAMACRKPCAARDHREAGACRIRQPSATMPGSAFRHLGIRAVDFHLELTRDGA